MCRVLALIALMGSSLPASSETCEGLGLASSYLTQHFCKQLNDLSKSGEPTRSVTSGDEIVRTGPVLPDWPDVTILQDAYRADPRKTLELIRRIKEAGGLTTD